ncbi:site-specific integrase [Wocania ichthyoenteri]|uniref:site-specific integrase n=1 Tax=Wocania ichthyoenteri TaxID=1230531 RepID=UPI0006898469|nr:site-specific integrase [Wocania ichthyoenteri]
MSHSLKLLIYIKKSKLDNLGKAPIYARITIDQQRAELSMCRKIEPSQWSNDTGLAKGSSKEIQELNRFIASIKSKIFICQQRLIEKGEVISAIKLRDNYLGKDKESKMLLETFQEHNDQIEKLIGIDFAPNTLIRYKTTKNHIQKYIFKQYKVKDIPLIKVDILFINNLEYYLKTIQKCSHNTSYKYVSNLKKIIRIAYTNGWIKTYPFLHYKSRFKIVDREFLTEKEIQSIIDKDFKIERLNQVKDIFIFSCFTGLAYSDVKSLSKSDIVIGIDGERWIKIKRTKTKTQSNIPILPQAETIIRKYSNNPDMLNLDRIFPVASNQKTNAYLKEIANICKISKNLTFHLARHTFATTITLTNGVSIESVSKMLGHKSLRTTQHYAKILDKKVSEDMNTLRAKMSIGKQKEYKPKCYSMSYPFSIK